MPQEAVCFLALIFRTRRAFDLSIDSIVPALACPSSSSFSVGGGHPPDCALRDRAYGSCRAHESEVHKIPCHLRWQVVPIVAQNAGEDRDLVFRCGDGGHSADSPASCSYGRHSMARADPPGREQRKDFPHRHVMPGTDSNPSFLLCGNQAPRGSNNGTECL